MKFLIQCIYLLSGTVHTGVEVCGIDSLLVRGDSLYVSDFQKSIHYFQMDAASGLGKGESPKK